MAGPESQPKDQIDVVSGFSRVDALANAEQLPFESESFDGCRAERTLQHVADPKRAVAEMSRVLKPGGRMSLVEPDWEGLLLEGSDPNLSAVIWRSRFNTFQ